METFIVIQKDKHNWAVVYKGDVDENGHLKKERKPISENHPDELQAKEEKEKIENKFGFSHATNSN